MSIISTILALILAVVGGIFGVNASSAPVGTPVPPPEYPQVSEMDTDNDSGYTLVNYTPFDIVERATAASDTIEYTPANDVDYYIPEDAYNVNIERMGDRVNVGYNVPGADGQPCMVSASYYDDGTAVSGINCEPLYAPVTEP